MKLKHPRFMINALMVFSVLSSGHLTAATAPKLKFEIGGNISTIGDIKPAFIDFSPDPVPVVPIREIIRRYKKLFDTTSDPVVRIDALWRLNGLEQKFGTEKEMSVKEEFELYSRAVESYDKLIAMKKPPYPLDQLLYQSARAYDMIGKQEQSIERLQRLVRQFPSSEVAPEGWFRVGEYHFANANYEKADQAYQKVFAKGGNTKFYDKALFMSGWARFKSDQKKPALESFSRVLDVAYAKTGSFDDLGKLDTQTVTDTLRAMSIIFSYEENFDAIGRLLHGFYKKPYIHHLYNRLSEFYFEQKRYEDSATINRSFINKFPNSDWAPVFAARNIEIYKQARFTQKLIAEKRGFVDRYAGNTAQLAKYSQEARNKLKPYLKQYLDDLSHLDYVAAQKSKNKQEKNALYLKAANYYETYADLLPPEKDSGAKMFLAGESYFNAGMYDKALTAYVSSAYGKTAHKKQREAAYATIVAFQQTAQGKLAKSILDSNVDKLATVNASQREAVDRNIQLSQQFIENYSKDKQVPDLLNNIAGLQYKVGDNRGAIKTALTIIDNKKSNRALLKSAHLLVANASYDQQDYAQAEQHYKAIINWFGPKERDIRDKVAAKMAASIYNQAEKDASEGNWEQAVATYIRLTKEVPNSKFKVNALYDASAELLKQEQWKKAIPLLVEFKQEYPTHSLTKEVSDKLILAYIEAGDTLFAADALYEKSNAEKGTNAGREALYQSAQLFEKANRKDQAINLYKQYYKAYPKPVAYSVEAGHAIAEYYLAKKDMRSYESWLRNLIALDKNAGDERSERTVLLAANASMWFATGINKKFDSIKLTLPLKSSLAKKRAALKDTVDAYQNVAQYGVTDLRTQANYRLAKIYGQLSKDLMASEKPKGLDELQLEQYEILLEEQAYPFEEKSIELHELNVKNTQEGIYDNWVKESYAELAKLFPARYVREFSKVDYAEKPY